MLAITTQAGIMIRVSELHPSVKSLTEQVGLVPLTVPLSVAIIASNPPEELSQAIHNTELEIIANDDALTGFSAIQAERTHDDLIKGVCSLERRKEARHKLEEALENEMAAPGKFDSLERQRAMGESIIRAQNRLSRPTRWLATIGCAVAVSSLFGGGYYALARDQANMSRPTNDPGVTRAQPIPEASPMDGKQELSITAIGTIGGLAGGIIGTMVGAGMAEDVAQRRARKIVRQAELAEGLDINLGSITP